MWHRHARHRPAAPATASSEAPRPSALGGGLRSLPVERRWLAAAAAAVLLLAAVFVVLRASTSPEGVPASSSSVPVDGGSSSGTAAVSSIVPPTIAPNSTRGPQASWHPTSYDVLVSAPSLSQAFFDSYPAGTRFALTSGVHRLATRIRFKPHTSLLGFPGAVISGAKDISAGWVQDSTDSWWIGGQTQQLTRFGSLPSGFYCETTNPLCAVPEDVLWDGNFLLPVADRASVRPGTFYFDHSSSRIYVGQNPAGHTIETDVVDSGGESGAAAVLQGTDLTVRNLVFDSGGTLWSPLLRLDGGLMDDCTVSHSHMAGVAAYGTAVIENSRIVHNGQLGISNSPARTENVEVAYNNDLGFGVGWEAGGAKYTWGSGMVIDHSWFHDNRGTGLWFDASPHNFVVENSVFQNNQLAGVSVELSWDGVVRGNLMSDNGQQVVSDGQGWYVFGVGILVSDSSNVQVTGNVSYGNKAGPIVVCACSDRWKDNRRWQPQQVSVTNNDFGFVGQPTDDVLYEPGFGNAYNSKAGFVCDPNNAVCGVDLNQATWSGNRYHVPSSPGTGAHWFAWGGVSLGFQDWQNNGRDLNGSIDTKSITGHG